MTDVKELSPDDVAVLEEERDFLLRSLRDLDAEHDAGDVDQHDYDTLRDDYTARAARVIRTIERHQARRVAEEPRSSLWRRVGVAAGVVLFALLAGLLVAQATGRREAGDTATGDIRETSRQGIERAVQAAADDDYERSITLLDEVLATAPDSVEAMTWKGWFLYRSGAQGEGLVTLTDAVELDDTFPATHAFLAVILAENGQLDYAREELARLDALDPPAQILQVVEPFRERLGTTSTTASP